MRQGGTPHGVKMGRRYKAYAAETGVSYQYFFESRRSVVRPEGQGRGSDYTFVITADQHPPFTLKVFVSDNAISFNLPPLSLPGSLLGAFSSLDIPS